MKTVLPFVLAVAFVTPVRGDECSDLRLAVRDRDAARDTLLEGDAHEDSAGEWIADEAESAIRVQRAVHDLIAKRGDHIAARTLQSLDEADTAVITALADTSALPGDPQDPAHEHLGAKVLSASLAIEEAREALALTVCS